MKLLHKIKIYWECKTVFERVLRGILLSRSDKSCLTPFVTRVSKFGSNGARIFLAIVIVIAALLFSQNSANAVVTYVASAANPNDNGSLGASSVAVTPPGGMTTGDLVILVANSRVNTVAMTMSAQGGQTWTAQTNINTTGSQRIFWARYNGTWSANPSVAFTDATNTTVVMHVFRPSLPANTWAIDVAQTSSASSPSGGNDDVSIASISTMTNGALVFATWTSVNNNQWALQTGGWANAGNSQYRNRQSSDASQSSAYQVKATFGATGAVVNRQTSAGPDNGNISIVAFKEVPGVVIAPTVTTNAASALTSTGATLNGTVSSNGASTTVTFDYGLTTGYGSSATATGSPLAAGATNTAVSAAVAGLTCNTLYHFRVKGVNSAGTSNGSDLTFTTSACPPTSVTANPTLCVNDNSIGVATGNWTGLTNVGTQNNVYAQASVANSDITNYLKCTGYGFSIPAGATITGITVGPWLNSTWTMLDNAMQLVKGGAIQATNLATGATLPNGGGGLAGAPTQFIYGSSTNLWGDIWTPANINSANFGAAFAAQRGGFATTQQAAVDAMPITINYTLPSTPTVTAINLASANPSSPATAVSWTVTFSTSVTGVIAGNFSLVEAGGVSLASITSVSGSANTWTVTADTGSGFGTLGLNMANVTGITPAITTAMPFVGQVYTISAPLTCIGDSFSTTGTLDTTLWDVRTILGPFLPQVIDAGGGDYRLRLTDLGNNEATFAQLKRTFPGAGNKIIVEIDYFAYGGSGADGIAITFSDATVSSTTGGFGGSLGYAQNNTNSGFGGGWLGIGLDEYGNFPNPTESRNGYPGGWIAPAPANVGAGFYKTNVSIRGSGSGTTGYSLLANTGLLATPVAPPSGAAGATPYRYRFTIDHSNGVNAWVTVERDLTAPLGDAFTVVVPTFDVKAANSGQATVPANWLLSFTGSTGGATNYHEIKQVNVCANSIVGGGAHHFEIEHASGTGVTCTPSTLTIKACADAAVPCAPYTAGVSGTLSASGSPTVNWTGGTGFTIASGSSTVTKNVQVTTPGNVVFDATSSPIPTAATTCNFGAPSCTFASSDAGFLISAPNHVAETNSTLTVQAVKKADSSLACVPAFAGTSKTVNLMCSYTNPVTGTLPVRVAGAALNATNSPAAACDAGGANVSLTFDASGIATPQLQYADVGQMSIAASFTGTAGALDAGLIMTGSGTFITAPSSFAFSAVTAGTIKAGDPFSATVTARNAAGNATPNFGQESSPEGVTLGNNLVSPLAGSNPPLANNVIAGGAFTNGIATVTNLSWGEVGNIALTATLSSADYLTSGVAAATGTSATVGPFIPHHLDTAVVSTVSTPMPCPAGLTCPTLFNGFIYSGQPFRVQVTARNLAGGTTTNYDGTLGFSKAVTLSAWDALGSLTAPTGAGTLVGSILAGAFSAGVATTSTPTYTFAVETTAPSDIYIRALDSDAVSSLRAIPANSVEGGVKVVSGRIYIPNAHGSELLPLPMTVTVQYYDAVGNWVTSTTDSDTQFNTDLSTSGGNIVSTVVSGLAGGLTVVTPVTTTVSAGVLNFTFNAPGIEGSSDISMNVPNYLLAGNNGAGVNPSSTARVTFGIFKGSEHIIYIREVY